MVISRRCQIASSPVPLGQGLKSLLLPLGGSFGVAPAKSKLAGLAKDRVRPLEGAHHSALTRQVASWDSTHGMLSMLSMLS